MNLSNCKIKLDKSSDYARLALLIYSSSLVLLFYSACVLPLKVMIMALLLLQLIRIINNPIPNPKYSMLNYNRTGWLLHDENGQQILYDKVRLVINVGLFFLLELSTENQRKLIVIFSDQITENDYRLLNIIEKIQ